MFAIVILCQCIISSYNALAFQQYLIHKQSGHVRDNITSLNKKKNSRSNGSGKGFGNLNDKSKIEVKKTYGSNVQKPVADLIDDEAAMTEFFQCNEEWYPLFRSIIPSSTFSAPFAAETFLFNQDDTQSNLPLEFSENTPWKKLPKVATGDENMAIISNFLDSSQKALLQIPVSEVVNEDINDLNFIEEGRRMLVVKRFQCIDESDEEISPLEKHDQLFRVCWSEILYLASENEEDTGSVIILPEDKYDMPYLRRYVDMNIQRPLDWLGLGRVFEVTSMQRESTAIRLIYKLSDVPDLADKPNE